MASFILRPDEIRHLKEYGETYVYVKLKKQPRGKVSLHKQTTNHNDGTVVIEAKSYKKFCERSKYLPGQKFWVKEKFGRFGSNWIETYYYADHREMTDIKNWIGADRMPKKYSRFNIEIKSINIIKQEIGRAWCWEIKVILTKP